MYRRQFLSCLAAPALACLLSGCGTLLHTERVGHPHSNQIDWKIAALDGLGMLLFFVPGVVAFAVDFYTGAIYLPRGECYPPHPFSAEGGEVPGGPMPPNSTDAALENLPALPSPELTTLQPAGRAPRNPATPRLQATRIGHVAVSSNDVPCRETVVPSASLDLRQIRVSRHQLRPRVLEQVVSRHVGRPVSLESQQTRLSVLTRLDCFHEQRRRHESDRGVDALHIATVAHHRVQYLLTWNCRHIANAKILPRIQGVLKNLGIPIPIIGTPEELLGDDTEND